MARLFISYALPDRAFALRLARSLEQLGHVAWVDAQEIPVGASIPRAVAAAVEQADYLIVVLSRHSAASAWSAEEWHAKYWEEIAGHRTMVLPALIEECSIPLFLRPKRHADFRSDYAVGLAQLATAIQEHAGASAPNGCIKRCTCEDVIAQQSSEAASVESGSPVCYTEATMQSPTHLAEVHVELELPYLGKIAGVWKPDAREQDAAWELYVELATRIAVAELTPGDGLLRESLTSLYSIFTTTRQILRRYGPAVARPKAESQISFGYLAISMLNYVLRPVLAKWHPLLLDYEHRRKASISALDHEQRWERTEELRQALNQVRRVLLDYTELLAQIARVPKAVPR